ncbi:Fasciclin-like arabinogalactan protein [Beauveria bassiana]|uniref:Fasciclin-like arabinogalactan protein n=1 Tax=Beauveria bassiana TaxID=176275 RepID=A0A2N6NJ39_BEABA|nr:Fasciclin-like arabinogalactan protein [Beauveria bassiana]
MVRIVAWPLALFTAAALAASSDDLGSVLQRQHNLTTFYDLIKICAPSDKAFENIPYTSLNDVWDPSDVAKTTALLQYHILQGSVTIADLESGPTYLERTLLTASAYTNVTAGQNVLIDKQPGDTIVLTSSLGTRCTVIEQDIAFSGGRIHVIDNLLIPPAPLRATAATFRAQSFLAALYAAGLMPDVDDRRNVTVFAPRDAAMDLVGGSLEAALQGRGGKAALARVMGYHVVPGRILSSTDLVNGTVLTTLSGGSNATSGSGSGNARLVVRQAGNDKFVNSAKIVQPDILLANGIMHLVADVLNPDAPSATPDPTLASQPPVFPVSVASSPFASALPCTSDCPTSTSAATASSTTTTTASSGGGKPTSSKNGGVPKPTAHAAAAALGVLGAGLLL